MVKEMKNIAVMGAVMEFDSKQSEEFGRLYAEHRIKLRKSAYRLTGSMDEAEELVSEVFSRAFEKYGNFRSEASFGTWIYRILQNLVFDSWKKRTEELPEVIEAKPSERPDAVFERRVLAVKIDEALVRLTQTQRQVFLMRELDGMRHSEIASKLNIAESTSKVHYFNAVKRLKEELNEYI